MNPCVVSACSMKTSLVQASGLLGGPLDVVTTYERDYNPIYNRGNPISPFRGIRSSVISPVIRNY